MDALTVTNWTEVEERDAAAASAGVVDAPSPGTNAHMCGPYGISLCVQHGTVHPEDFPFFFGAH